VTARLECWALCSTGDGYTAPEVFGRCLRGVVTGHHRKDDGERVVTSRVVSAEGRTATTASGTTYELGEPDPEWLAWMVEHGIAFNPDSPIRMVPP